MKSSEFIRRLFHCFGRWLAAACLLTTLSRAEEAAKVSLRALLLAPRGSTVTVHSIFEGKASDPVTITANGLTESFSAPSRRFSLGLPDQKAETGFRSVGDVMLPDQGDDFILLLEPRAEKFIAHVVASRDSRFVGDSMLFFNASEAPVMAVLGSEKTLIKPSVAVFVKAPSRGKEAFFSGVLYQYKDGSAKPFFSSRWIHNKDSRRYVLIYRNEAGRLAHQAVAESLITPPTPRDQQVQ